MKTAMTAGKATKEDIDILNQKLNRFGVSFSFVYSEGQKDLQIDFDEEQYNRAVKRNAGRPYAILKEGSFLAHITKGEVLDRLRNESMAEIAASLSISRRTLYRRMNEARSNDDELL